VIKRYCLAFLCLQKTNLRNVFIFYCSWAEKNNYLYMSRTQFLRMCRDTGIMGPHLDAVALNIMFQKVRGHGSQRGCTGDGCTTAPH
jgi:hypothetical protein